MALFGNYENAGPGIAKNAPKKKPFFRYWELVFRKFWKLIEVNMLMMPVLLPIFAAIVVIYKLIANHTNLALGLAGILLLASAVCFGPVMAGCTQILRKFSLEKPCFLLDTFFKTFKSNFRQSLVLGLIDILVATSVASSFYVYPKIIEGTTEGSTVLVYVLFIATLSLGIAVLMMSFYGYLMIVSTELPMKNILKNSLALSILALKKNLITLVIAAAVMLIFTLLTVYLPAIFIALWVFIPTAFVAFMIVFNCYPVIQQYIINPYYTQRGEVNPELQFNDTNDENLFEDRGGKEAPIEVKKEKNSKKRKVIS